MKYLMVIILFIAGIKELRAEEIILRNGLLNQWRSVSSNWTVQNNSTYAITLKSRNNKHLTVKKNIFGTWSISKPGWIVERNLLFPDELRLYRRGLNGLNSYTFKPADYRGDYLCQDTKRRLSPRSSNWALGLFQTFMPGQRQDHGLTILQDHQAE